MGEILGEINVLKIEKLAKVCTSETFFRNGKCAAHPPKSVQHVPKVSPTCSSEGRVHVAIEGQCEWGWERANLGSCLQDTHGKWGQRRSNPSSAGNTAEGNAHRTLEPRTRRQTEHRTFLQEF